MTVLLSHIQGLEIYVMYSCDQSYRNLTGAEHLTYLPNYRSEKTLQWNCGKSSLRQKIEVVPISLDETETEIKAWEQRIKKLTGWKHLHTSEGVRSKVATDYFVLATPVMVLVDARTKKIVALPNTISELMTVTQ